MIAECKRNPRVLAGEILEKIGAIDLKPLDEENGSTANQFLTNRGAIKGALEQIKLGRIPAMHVRMLDATHELSNALASIKEECENNIFELHSLEANATEEKAPEIVEQRKRVEHLYDTTGKALATFTAVLPLIAEQLIDYSPQQELQRNRGMTVGV
jgi:hypothetical protein